MPCLATNIVGTRRLCDDGFRKQPVTDFRFGSWTAPIFLWFITTTTLAHRDAVGWEPSTAS
jgi:hypothetical protein